MVLKFKWKNFGSRLVTGACSIVHTLHLIILHYIFYISSICHTPEEYIQIFESENTPYFLLFPKDNVADSANNPLWHSSPMFHTFLRHPLTIMSLSLMVYPSLSHSPSSLSVSFFLSYGKMYASMVSVKPVPLVIYASLFSISRHSP